MDKKPFSQQQKPRRKNKSTDRESQEQQAFFNWLSVQHPEINQLAFHVPNGGRRDKITGAKLKKEGVKAGVPDIFIMLPRGGYHGLMIEFKASPPYDAAVHKNQREWIEKLSSNGYLALVCKGLSEAIGCVNDYLSMEGTC